MGSVSPRSLFIGAWVTASGLGLAISGAFAGALAPNGGEFGIESAHSVAAGIRNFGLPAALAFAVWGAGLGVSQWAVVHGRLPGARWWPATTIAGWALAGATIGTTTGALGGGLNAGAHDAGSLGEVASVVASALAIGLIPATFQWLILRRSAQSWSAFSIRFVAGLSLGGLAGWGAASTLGLTLPSGPAWIVVGAAIGTAIGWTTAPPIARSIALGEG